MATDLSNSCITTHFNAERSIGLDADGYQRLKEVAEN